jgi:cell division protein FtsB
MTYTRFDIEEQIAELESELRALNREVDKLENEIYNLETQLECMMDEEDMFDEENLQRLDYEEDDYV